MSEQDLQNNKETNDNAFTQPNDHNTRGSQKPMPPRKTINGQLWTYLDIYTCILYPFVEGHTGFENRLSEDQWKELGAAFIRIHSIILSAVLQIHRDEIRFIVERADSWEMSYNLIP